MDMEDKMVHSTIRLLIAAKKRNEVLGILSSVAERCRIEPGCISCHVYQDTEEERVVMLEEIWRSEKDLKRHLRSEEYLKVLLSVEMALKPPEIRFNTISHSTGFETIEKARNFIPGEGRR